MGRIGPLAPTEEKALQRNALRRNFGIAIGTSLLWKTRFQQRTGCQQRS